MLENNLCLTHVVDPKVPFSLNINFTFINTVKTKYVFYAKPNRFLFILVKIKNKKKRKERLLGSL